MNKAIVIGGFVNALGLVRSLHETGSRVGLVTTAPYDIAQHSKYVEEHFRLPEAADRPTQLAEWLLQRKEAWEGASVFPSTDEALHCLTSHREDLERHYRLILPPPQTVPFLLDRTKMMGAAAAVGIAVPLSYGSSSQALDQAVDIDYPVVVKPIRSGEFQSRFGTKLFPVHDSAELTRCVHQLSSADVPGEVFDLVPGPDRTIYAHCVYMDGKGQPLAECTVRKLRQSPAGFGIARVAECVAAIPALREQAIELLRHIGHRGLGVVEFKYDERDGTHRFIEVNGRSVVYNRLLQKAGLDFTALATADFVNGDARQVPAGDWAGVWIHLHADFLRSLLQGREDEAVSLGDYLSPYRRSKVFAVWSSRDPGPFRAQWGHSGRQLAGRLFGGRSSKADRK